MVKKCSYLMLLVGLSNPVFSADTHPSWSYQGDTAPEHWSRLSPEYATCQGYNQTPINITGSINAQLPALDIHYRSPAHNITNNGHTIQVDYADGSHMTVDGERFFLKQMHFHTPSENHIEGRSFAMELHLVHANAAGALAVIGVMFEPGPPHVALAQLWQHMPKHTGQHAVLNLSSTLFASAFLPKQTDYYRFSGSLTTPPCSEGVRWLVMKQPLQASPQQIEQLQRTMGSHTNRPLQTLNGRVIVH